MGEWNLVHSNLTDSHRNCLSSLSISRALSDLLKC